MKTQYYRGDPDKLKRMLEEYKMIGYRAEIKDDELIVYYGNQPRQTKKVRRDEKAAERWSKRERNFGYTRNKE